MVSTEHGEAELDRRVDMTELLERRDEKVKDPMVGVKAGEANIRDIVQSLVLIL